MAALATLSTPVTNDTANSGGGGATSSTATGSGNAVERRCENADCNVIKLVSMVPKRKITQFVTEPTVMEKPMLINGFTTVFQVEGSSAKLSDLKNPNPNTPLPSKPIYRIVPNTHAHIVNYVVVDADGDSLRKINEGDPATMRKLLESQKVSADQMLKKLMAGHAVSVPITSTATTMASTAVNTSTAVTTLPSRSAVTTNTVAIASSTVTITSNNSSARASTAPSIVHVSGSNASNSGAAAKASGIQLPLRMHPNLKISAVASRDAIGKIVSHDSTTNAPQSVQGSTPASGTHGGVPLITPVPLANLQSSTVAASTTDKPNIDKMQAELAELRRTVAMLAEAMPKNALAQEALVSSQQAATQPTNRAVAVKRPRLN